LVPYPPESQASGIGDASFHHVVWYRRNFSADELRAAGLSETNSRIIIHFGAVDWAADVWLNNIYLGRHEGGQSPFSFDATHAISAEPNDATAANTLIVRAVDDPHDVSVPRGKQDWLEAPHKIWYH